MIAAALLLALVAQDSVPSLPARARAMLTNAGIIVGEDEARGVSSVLNAAALTYVAALVTALLQLLYYASMVFGLGRRRR